MKRTSVHPEGRGTHRRRGSPGRAAPGERLFHLHWIGFRPSITITAVYTREKGLQIQRGADSVQACTASVPSEEEKSGLYSIQGRGRRETAAAIASSGRKRRGTHRRPGPVAAAPRRQGVRTAVAEAEGYHVRRVGGGRVGSHAPEVGGIAARDQGSAYASFT
jgi:hypothetical protein